MGVGELPVEPRLADARFADHGNELPVALRGFDLSTVQLGHLRVAAHETGEAPCGPRL